MIKRLSYKQHLTDAMNDISMMDNSIFIGQGVKDGGHGISPTLEGVDNRKKIELPVFEELQTGLALGLAMDNNFVVSIYPRFDFFILSLNQLVNHVDKLPEMSNKEFLPNIIFRVAVGAKKPLDAGPQHTQNHTSALKMMLDWVKIIELSKGSNPRVEYQKALKQRGTFVMVEHYDLYGVDV